jgi:hypothetical protein
MNGESPILDYKADFDRESPRAKLELVRDVIAIANSGGGRIVVGHDEVRRTGVTRDVVEVLDSAKVAEWLRNYASPAPIHLSHEIEEISRDRFLITLGVSRAEFPVVISKRGLWKGADRKEHRPVFELGDVFVRHSTRTERANYEDFRQWIVKATESERSTILDRLTTLVNLPEGTELQLISQAGQAIDTPGRLLDNAIRRRERDPGHLLSTYDLLWLFRLRHNCDFTEPNLRILVASSLRRNPTLYWWLVQADAAPAVVSEEVFLALEASDRDKSDAARSIIEVASIYLEAAQLRQVISSLQSSRYTHFRREASNWAGRAEARRRLARRIQSARYESMPMLSYSRVDLEQFATTSADRLLRRKSVSFSRTLSDLTRAIWALESKHATFLEDRRKGAA